MPGNWITSQQVELYMQARRQGLNQVISAAKAGISERSGRAIEQGQRQDPKQSVRSGRTRPDPLEEVWESELLPLLTQMPLLQPITLLEYLQDNHRDEAGNCLYPDSILRTLQRRVKLWKAVQGPKQEVMFRQTHNPGQLGLSDFTRLKGVTITIRGEPLDHLLYHFRLAFSHWSHVKVILGGESYTALAEGLQEALWRLGGSPQLHRTDSLSAAFKNLSEDAKLDMTVRYEVFCQHYGMKATRNNPGQSHENGSVESAHGHIKRRIKQGLLLRGHHDFNSLDDYQQFIDMMVNQHNRRNAKAIAVERLKLHALPINKSMDYTEVVATVTSASTIDVKRVTYTVPSQLQGEVLRIRLYHDRLYCYLGAREVCQLKRTYPTGRTGRGHQVDYRHVIHSLVKKPQAFRYSQLRDHLLPTPTYQTIWQEVDHQMEPKLACKFMVGLLHLAATQDCEQPLGDAVMQALSQRRQLRLVDFQSQFLKVEKLSPVVQVPQHELASYDHFINSAQGG